MNETKYCCLSTDMAACGMCSDYLRTCLAESKRVLTEIEKERDRYMAQASTQRGYADLFQEELKKADQKIVDLGKERDALKGALADYHEKDEDFAKAEKREAYLREGLVEVRDEIVLRYMGKEKFIDRQYVKDLKRMRRLAEEVLDGKWNAPKKGSSS